MESQNRRSWQALTHWLSGPDPGVRFFFCDTRIAGSSIIASSFTAVPGMPGNELTTDAIFLTCIEHNPQNSQMSTIALVNQGSCETKDLIDC